MHTTPRLTHQELFVSKSEVDVITGYFTNGIVVYACVYISPVGFDRQHNKGELLNRFGMTSKQIIGL